MRADCAQGKRQTEPEAIVSTKQIRRIMSDLESAASDEEETLVLKRKLRKEKAEADAAVLEKERADEAEREAAAKRKADEEAAAAAARDEHDTVCAVAFTVGLVSRVWRALQRLHALALLRAEMGRPEAHYLL